MYNILKQQAGGRIIATFTRSDGIKRTSHFATMQEVHERLAQLQQYGDTYTITVHN